MEAAEDTKHFLHELKNPFIAGSVRPPRRKEENGAEGNQKTRSERESSLFARS